MMSYISKVLIGSEPDEGCGGKGTGFGGQGRDSYRIPGLARAALTCGFSGSLSRPMKGEDL